MSDDHKKYWTTALEYCWYT